jgi:hypothetical protein
MLSFGTACGVAEKLEEVPEGRPQGHSWRDVWIMQSGALGFEFQTLREYWRKVVRSEESSSQYPLLVHRDVVQDLSNIIERLSFPADSAKEMRTTPDAPEPYRLVAPLGSEGAWKEVWVGTSICAPEAFRRSLSL